MKIDLKYRHTIASEELNAYVTEHLEKLEKFEMKPVKVEATFTTEKDGKRVDLHARGQDIDVHAHATGKDFFQSVDHALEKMARQLERKKSKVQAHKSHAVKAPKVS